MTIRAISSDRPSATVRENPKNEKIDAKAETAREELQKKTEEFNKSLTREERGHGTRSKNDW